MPFELACPECQAPLGALESDRQRCARCGVDYHREGGIWGFLRPGRRAAAEEFIDRYSLVRQREGRDAPTAEDLLALPYRDRTGRHVREWSVRAASFEALLEEVVIPREERRAARSRILDAGAGVGWLAYRLAHRGHELAALDLVRGDVALGAHAKYPTGFLSIQAELLALPFASRSVDLVIFNASLHYASSFAATLREALRVLVDGGRIVVMDTPFYRDSSSGRAMLAEREKAFRGRYGLRETREHSEGFLTGETLERLEKDLGISWAIHQPWYGLRWWAKPWVARLKRSREPAQFMLIVGKRRGES